MKWRRTVIGSYSWRPFEFWHPWRVQPQGKLSRSTWQLIPFSWQLHDSGSQNSLQEHPQICREYLICIHSIASCLLIFLTPAAFKMSLRSFCGIGMKQWLSSLSALSYVSSVSLSLRSSSDISVLSTKACLCFIPSVVPPFEGTHV